MRYEVKKEGRLITITIDNECGLSAKLTNLGASIISITYNNELMTLTPKAVNDFMKPNAFYGKTVGPTPNRIKDGLVDINGTIYTLDKNEGENTLHGGKYGLSNQFFKYNVIKEKKFIGVNFMLVKKNKADGLPGKITYNIGYVMQEGDNTLYLSFSAFSDADTIMGLTNHTYFTLGDKNINALKLTIPSHRFIETNKEDLLPVQERDILPCLDFNKAKRMDKNIKDEFLQNHKTLGYDHCFLLDEGKITLENNKYKLDITTDFKAVQVYSDNYNDEIKMMGTDELTHRGLAIEPQDNLLNRLILGKRQFYNRKITYHFIKK